MRTLLLLRGIQASGKSTWIKENNLEPYTLSADSIRLNIANPVLLEDGSYEISQKYNKVTWELLYKYLEMRMQNGDFTIIDATHSDIKLMNKYRDLANTYKYTMYCLEFDVSLEEALKRNKERDNYKYVPERVIERTYETIKNNEKLPSGLKKINSIDEIINFYTADVNEYKKVIIIGDIHSCAEPLKEILKDFNEETLYVFVGDYFDRGIQPVETFKIMLDLLEKPNVILIEGNHEEKSVKKFIYDEEKYTKSFEETTLLPLLKEYDVDYVRASLKKIYKKLRQCFAFEFRGKKFLCTHGGLPLVPKLTLVSAKEMIHGVGKYETEIGEIYSENYKKDLCQDFIQVHGHRGINDGEYSYCLEARVEFGGELKILTIDNDGNIEKFGEVFQNEVIFSLSYFDTDKDEKYYKVFLIGIFVALMNDYVRLSERESGHGRADLILEPKKKENPGYIFEFKVAGSEEELENYAEEGFEQIDEKEYDTELINRGVTEITYIGLAFYKKKLKMKYEKHIIFIEKDI